VLVPLNTGGEGIQVQVFSQGSFVTTSPYNEVVLLKDVLLAKEQQRCRQQLLKEAMLAREAHDLPPASECGSVSPTFGSGANGAVREDMWWEGCTPVPDAQRVEKCTLERNMQTVIVDNMVMQSAFQQVWAFAKSLPSTQGKCHGISQGQFNELHQKACSAFARQGLKPKDHRTPEQDWWCEVGLAKVKECTYDMLCRAWLRLVDRYAFALFITKGLQAYADANLLTLSYMENMPHPETFVSPKSCKLPAAGVERLHGPILSPGKKKKKLRAAQQSSVDALSLSRRHRSRDAMQERAASRVLRGKVHVLDTVLIHHQVDSVLMHQEATLKLDPVFSAADPSLIKLIQAHQHQDMLQRSLSPPRQLNTRTDLSRSGPQHKRWQPGRAVNPPSATKINRTNGSPMRLGSSAQVVANLLQSVADEHRQYSPSRHNQHTRR
jgi:hypothetical protein